MSTATLTEHQKAQLENIDCDTLARDTLTSEELRAELDKLKNDAEKEKTCRAILSVTGTQTASLMKELSSGTWDAPVGDGKKDADAGEPAKATKKPKENSEVATSDLPIAPTTTFDIIRLMQLGYIPVDKPGTWKSPKWIFYGPNAWTQWGNSKANTWALDWAGGKQNNAYRAMLDSDISKIHDELKGYQKNTAGILNFNTELQKQLDLLESLRNEKDPKKIIEISKEYVDSRSKTHFTPGALGYDMPAVRKTSAELNAEIARAETKTQTREDRIKADEVDLKALTTKGAKDSTGTVRMTKEEIEERNQRRIERATSMSDRNIKTIDTDLSKARSAVQKYSNEYEALKLSIAEKNRQLVDIKRNDGGRTPAEINNDMGTHRTNVKVMGDLRKELATVNDRIRIEGELAKLGILSALGIPEKPIPPNTSLVYSTYNTLQIATNEVNRATVALDDAKQNKEKLLKDATKRGKDDLDAHAKEVALKQKHITQGKEVLTKRQEAETRVAEVNGKIKDIEAKLAGTPAAHERSALESELKGLYAEKNAATQAFEAALKSNGGRNDAATKNAIDGQKAEVQKELDKLKYLGTEMDTIKTKIDDMQKSVQDAKDALNNEKDPAKAKKLRDEMPAKINAANKFILEQNLVGEKLVKGSGINWGKVPDMELESVLKKNLLLSKFLATPSGVITKIESFGETTGGQKTMKVVYGGLKYVAVVGAARTVGNEIAEGKIKEAGLDALDAGMGFVGMIPGGNIISGVYDIGMAGKQFVTGTDINGRNVSTTQSFVRLGFGIVGLIPVVGNVVKGVAAAKGMIKTVSAVEKVESAANITMKGAALSQVGTLTYDVVDVTANMVRNPADTAFKLLKGHEQNGIIFTKPTK